MKELPASLHHYITEIMPKMEGWCSPEKAEALARAVIDVQPVYAVEIGVFAGRSLLAIALAMRECGGSKVFGIDPWKSDESAKGWEGDKPNHDYWKKIDHADILRQARKSIQDQMLGSQVELIEATSKGSYEFISSAVTDIRAHGEDLLGLLHIDGNHCEEQAVWDVDHYVPLVKPGGIIIFDDTNWSTTKKAQERLAEYGEFMFFVEKEGQQCAFYRKRQT